MIADDHFEDIWTIQSGMLDTQSKPPSQIKQIDGVVPLDDQFGIHPLKTVPDALYEPLFGDPALQTYAILDAAKVTNLTELVADSGLGYRCLFKGDAFDELKDVAPWIVRLEDGNAFTRNLFTQTNAQWHLWDQEPGIYLRSSGTLDDMCKHFRKFTKVQDEQGKWFYFRFWEPNAFVQLLEQSDMTRLLTPPEGCVFHSFCVPTKDMTYTVSPLEMVVDEIKPFKLTTKHLMSFDASIESKFVRDYAVTLMRAAPVRITAVDIQGHDVVAQMVTRVIQYIKPLGFAKRSDLGRIASCAMFYGTHFLHDPRIAGLSQLYLTDTESTPGLRAKRFEEALRKTVPLDVITGAAGVVKVLLHMRFALDRMSVPQDYLAQVYTPEFGFYDTDTVQRFIQACQSQQPANMLDSFKHQAAHFILSALYTPYFLDDPLHTTLQSIFRRTDDFETHLFFEIERRITVLKES